MRYSRRESIFNSLLIVWNSGKRLCLVFDILLTFGKLLYTHKNTLIFFPDCRFNEIELGFVVDGSSSVQAYGQNNFQMMKNFTKSLILSFDVSGGSTRVGVVVYSTNSTVAFKLNQYSNFNQVEQAIDGIPYPGGGTYTGKALNKAASDLYNDDVVRENVRKVLVVMTDGVSTDAVTQPAALLNDSGVLVFVVAIGQNVDHTQLTEMAHGKTEYVFTAEFHSLGIAINDVRGAICRGSEYMLSIFAFSLPGLGGGGVICNSLGGSVPLGALKPLPYTRLQSA